MKIRYRLAAVVSAVALTGTAALAGAGAASANTDFPWCDGTAGYCLLSNGSGNALGLRSNTISAQTHWDSEDATPVNGETYVEYYQVGTNACLTDSGAIAYLQTCSGDSRQLWWYNAGAQEIINDYATVHYGHNDCLVGNLGEPDTAVIEACSLGGVNEIWDQTAP
jgi:hypothetical protein